MDSEFIGKVKEAMGYIDSDQCCGSCRYFVPSNQMSGNVNAKPDHCTLSPAFDLPVHTSGRCKFFSHKRMAVPTN